MLKQGGGNIVNTSSVCGLRGDVNNTGAYIASKHGVIGLAKAAALEYAKAGIRVNVICPGAIHTPMLESSMAALPDLSEVIKHHIPMGRAGTPEEIAGTAVWLCSDAASYVTGQSIVIDGGLIA